MYHVYFDSGTSNTRAYLLDGGKIAGTAKKNIGSKDSSIAGCNLVLVRGLKELYDQLLVKHGLRDEEIGSIYASGMVTSPFGIREVPHLSTPVSLDKLQQEVFTCCEPSCFKRNIHLIRGVKTVPEDYAVDKFTVHDVNNMRGEEIEIFGMLSDLPENWKAGSMAVFLPGSHTHVAYVKQRVLYDILSTFSGELYHAITQGTILAGSVITDTDTLDEEMVLLGFHNLNQYGINRALYIAHATKIFNAADNIERKSYLEGVITGGVISVFEKTLEEKWNDIDRVLIAGSRGITHVYEILLKEMKHKLEIMTLHPAGEYSFALKGLLEILKLHAAGRDHRSAETI